MNQITRYHNVDDTLRLGAVLAQSGFFNDVRGEAQAVVKILAGRELGIGEIAAMTGIHVIQGRVTIGANLMAAAVKRSGKYDYRVREMSTEVCKIEFLQGGESLGTSIFTLADARKAGTKNLDKFARNMLFARAMSNGVRWFCPDVLGGAPVYTPEEMGADTDEEGNVIAAAVTVEPLAPPPSARPTKEQFDLIETLSRETWGAEYREKGAEFVMFGFNKPLKEFYREDADELIEALRHNLQKEEQPA